LGDQFHHLLLPLCPSTGGSWCSLMISTLSLSSLGTYTFPSLYMTLSTFLYSSSLNIFTLTCFISSTAFTTSLSFILDCLTFPSKSIPSTMISTISVLLASSYSSFANISFLSSLSMFTSQSGLLLRLSVFYHKWPLTDWWLVNLIFSKGSKKWS